MNTNIFLQKTSNLFVENRLLKFIIIILALAVIFNSFMVYRSVKYQRVVLIPHSISIALAKGSDTPRLDYPPISIHRFSKEALLAGIDVHHIDNVPIRIYSPEKTLADCFKFRNKIGMDVVLEALKLYKIRKEFKSGEILKYAKICRVENIMRPYLEMSV